MKSFGVPDKPGNQLAIELVGDEQQLFMVIDKFFLDGSIEPFHMGIHLGSSGVGVPMVFVQPSKFFIEVLHELRAVAAPSAPPAPARHRGLQPGGTWGARRGASHAA